MNKIRCFLMAIALVATLGGLSLQGSMAQAAARQHVSAPSVAGKVAWAGIPRPYPVCPFPGSHDC